MKFRHTGLFATVLIVGVLAFGELAADDSRVEFVQQLEEQAGEPWTPNNHIELLDRGEEFFPRRIEMIRDAEETIDLITFNWCDDEAGRTVARELAAAKDRGVRVRLILDTFNAPVKWPTGIYRKLNEEGLDPLIFNPPNWDWGRLNDRIHEKMMVVDGEESLIGGANLCDGYLGKTDPTWQEFEFYIEGPLNYRVQGHFDRTWNRMARMEQQAREALQADPVSRTHAEQRGAEPYAPPKFQLFERTPSDPPAAGDSPALLLYQQSYFDDLPGADHRSIYADLIGQAEKRIILYSPFFIPPPEFKQALVEAAQNGVQIQVYTNSPGTNTHSETYANASRARFFPLLEAGVEIYEAQEAMTHAKGLLIDRHYLAVGSHNFTNRSFEYNGEVMVLTVDRDAIDKFEGVADRNFDNARRLEFSDLDDNGPEGPGIVERSQREFYRWFGQFF